MARRKQSAVSQQGQQDQVERTEEPEGAQQPEADASDAPGGPTIEPSDPHEETSPETGATPGSVTPASPTDRSRGRQRRRSVLSTATARAAEEVLESSRTVAEAGTVFERDRLQNQAVLQRIRRQTLDDSGAVASSARQRRGSLFHAENLESEDLGVRPFPSFGGGGSCICYAFLSR